MPLSAADLEWIRRLPTQPSSEDRAKLRAMRRSTALPDELRVLDSLLTPIRRAKARTQQRTELERRLELIDDLLSEDGQERLATAVHRGALRIVGHRASASRRLPTQADQNAAVRVANLKLKEQRRALEQERTDIKARLRNLRKAERSSA